MAMSQLYGPATYRVAAAGTLVTEKDFRKNRTMDASDEGDENQM
jgi:hypothetical protein